MPALGPHELSKSEAQQKVRELMKEIHHLKAMELAHRTMCRAAANEILREWDAHCDEEGYGPCNLVARLNGKSPPDLYPAYATEAEHNQWIAWRHGQNTPAQPPQVG